MGFGNWFRTKYLRLQLLHHPFFLLCGNNTSSHCSTLSTICIKATVCSIRYVAITSKSWVDFDPINWQLMLDTCSYVSSKALVILNLDLR